MKKNKITILFGESEVKRYDQGEKRKNLKDNISDFYFNTNEEIKAFILGLETALGWEDFLVINN